MNAEHSSGANGEQSPFGDHVFGRKEELHLLQERIASRCSFLLHGPAGVGKTLLLSALLPGVPKVLYSGQNPTPQALYRNLAETLLSSGNRAPVAMRGKQQSAIQGKTAVALKGIVREALRNSDYLLVFDHLLRPSQALAAAVRELKVSCSVPVVAVSRSDHMEDAGFVLQLFPDRRERLALRNFDPGIAAHFAGWCAEREELKAENVALFLDKVVEFSSGNPDAILQMIRMAKSAKYSHDGQIRVTPLYIDYQLAMVAHG
jgi:hypothetical protein